MTYADLLPHTARVYRAAATEDRFGQPADPMDSTTAVHTTIACRLVTAKSGGVLNDERTIWVYEDRYVLHAEAGVDVKESDVVEILDPAGAVLMPKCRVRQRKDVYAAATLHHVEMDLEVRRGPLP